MQLSFRKMHGAGNDFVMLDAVRQSIQLTPAQARFLADRKHGVGADQVLLIETATQQNCDLRYRIFNADGNEVEHCGNGARCAMVFAYELGLISRSTAQFQTPRGSFLAHINAKGEVVVNMGQPNFVAQDLPMLTDALPSRIEGETELWSIDAMLAQLPYLDTNHRQQLQNVQTFMVASMGNPHAVFVVNDVMNFPVATLGAAIEAHPFFPHQVNVGFVELISHEHVKLRVFERGVGETLACGTGACAAAALLLRRGWVHLTVTLEVLGGELVVRQDEANNMWLGGPAESVFDGVIQLKDEKSEGS